MNLNQEYRKNRKPLIGPRAGTFEPLMEATGGSSTAPLCPSISYVFFFFRAKLPLTWPHPLKIYTCTRPSRQFREPAEVQKPRREILNTILKFVSFLASCAYICSCLRNNNKLRTRKSKLWIS